MKRAWLVQAVLLAATAWGAAPSYSLAGIVNCSDYAPGPFAPNSIVSIFGTDLARSTGQATVNPQAGVMPTEIDGTRVYLNDVRAPLFYVSPGQINFLIPSFESSGEARVRVVTNGLTGPEVKIMLVDAAPALFTTEGGFAIATHTDYSLVRPDAPARPGEVVVIWATGLGYTERTPEPGEFPRDASPLARLDALKLMLGGTEVDASRILYAGLTPLSVGLYQINFKVPENSGTDPEVRVAVGAQASAPGLKLAVR